MDLEHIRNFCIIAHIDHGKSTLADRLIECTHTLAPREMRDQVLDQMDLERERGITIKLQPVQMQFRVNEELFSLNLIDTPGHVDFSYEVSRSLAACEGAILLVDATQGIQAQTLANLYAATSLNLEIIPVLNKMDLPNADVEKVGREVTRILGCDASEILHVSAKTGKGVPELLRAVIQRVPRPLGSRDSPLRALIFDSHYDDYRGVVASVRIVDGVVQKGDALHFLATEVTTEALEVGVFHPKMQPADVLTTGSVGYLVTGLKEVERCRVGDTITRIGSNVSALPGYRTPTPMVFAGLFCRDASQNEELRNAIAQLKLNDASLFYEPEHSDALGFGFRCGFLGLLHLDIIRERLKREYRLDLIVTVPSVVYQVTLTSGTEREIRSPLELPSPNEIREVREPWLRISVVTPSEYIGNMLQLIAIKRGYQKTIEYVDPTLAIIEGEMPLSQMITDFYDALKSTSKGYASMNYAFLEFRPTDVERLDIVVSGERVESLATIVYTAERERQGRRIVKLLKEHLPRQQFEVRIQALVHWNDSGKQAGGKVVASERLSALRKDVTAKLYGGDVTRKMKLLKKQKKGKARLRGSGHVEIPSDAFMAVLKTGND